MISIRILILSSLLRPLTSYGLLSSFSSHFLLSSLQTHLEYDANRPIYVVQRRFTSYRKLFQALYTGLFVENKAQSVLERRLLQLEEVFPRTFKRQSLGIKLDDNQLGQR